MGRPLTHPAKMTAALRADHELLTEALEVVRTAKATDETRALRALEKAAPKLLKANGTALGAGPDFSLLLFPFVFRDGAEVTQVVQDHLGTVPLVAGKTTLVRCYLRYAKGPVEVRGELQVASSPTGPWSAAIPSSGTAKLDPARSGSSLTQLTSRRRTLAYSLNFELPAALTNAGDRWFRISSIVTTQGKRLPSFAFFPFKATFVAAPPLRLRLVKMRYTSGNPATTQQPSATDVSRIESWLRRAYPIASLQLSTVSVTANNAAPFQAVDVNAQLAALRAQDLTSGVDGRTHYYGLVADSGFFMRGQASGIPTSAKPSTVASGPTGPGTFGWDNDGSYGDWYTGHELGHTFGRFHAEFCGAAGGSAYPFANGQLSDADERYVGIDTGDAAIGAPRAVLPGVDWHDVMTYCSNQWLSSFTYTGILDRLRAEDALGSTTTAGIGGAMPAAGAPLVQVVAVVNLSRSSGRITSVLPVSPAAANDAGEPTTGNDELTVTVRDAAGAVLHQAPVAFIPNACELPGEDRVGLVDATIPNLDQASSVELSIGGTVVDRYTVRASAQGAELRTAAPGAAGAAPGAPGASGELTVSWDRTEGVRYVVQVSADGGAAWSTLAAGTTEDHLSIDAADYPDVAELTVRVIASGGVGQPTTTTTTLPLR